MSSDWTDVGNWDAGGVPDAGKNVVVPVVGSAYPSTAGAAAPACAALTIGAGASLTIAAGFDLTTHGSMSLSGTVNGGGELRCASSAGSTSLLAAGTIDVDVRLLSGSGRHALSGRLRGSLFQDSGAGEICFTQDTVTVDGLTDLRGGGLVGSLTGGRFQGTFSAHDVTIRAMVPVVETGILRCTGIWDSDSSLQPASGTVVFEAGGPQSVTVVANQAWASLEIAGMGTSVGFSYANDLDVAQNLIVNAGTSLTSATNRLTVGGTLAVVGDLTLGNATLVQTALHVDVNGTLSAPNATVFRFVGGSPSNPVNVLGTIDTPSALLDVDGSIGFGPSGVWNLRAGVHEVHHSLQGPPSATMTFSGASTLRFVGSSGAQQRFSGSYPANRDVVFAAGTPLYAIGDQQNPIVTVRGDLTQEPGGGQLFTSQSTLQVTGTTTLRGGGLLGSIRGGAFPGTFDFHDVDIACQVPIADTGNLHCSGTWVSDTSFQPTIGRVVFDGGGSQSVTVVAGQSWASLEFAVAGTRVTLSSDGLNVARNLIVSQGTTLNSTATSIQVGLQVNVYGTLSVPNATVFRMEGGSPNNPVNVLGTIDTPSALLDVDGSIGFGPSGVWNLGAGVHTVHHSLQGPPSASMTFSGASTLRFVGNSGIQQRFVGSYPVGLDVVFAAGTPQYAIGDQQNPIVTVRGDLTQEPGGGQLFTSQSTLQVAGTTTLRGGGLLGSIRGGAFPGTFDFHDVDIACQVPIADMGNLHCSGTWVSDISFQPAIGRVVFDGGGPQSVTVVANQSWASLETAVAGTQVSFSFTDDLNVAGSLIVNAGTTLTSATNLLTVGGTLAVVGDLTLGNATVVQTALHVDVNGTLSAPNATVFRFAGGSPSNPVNVLGTIDTPSALLDVDGSIGLGPSGVWNLGAGVHEVHHSLQGPPSATMTFSGASTLRFVGSSGAQQRFSGSYPANLDVVFAAGTPQYAIGWQQNPIVTVRGDLTQEPGGGQLFTSQSTLQVMGTTVLRGGGLLGSYNGGFPGTFRFHDLTIVAVSPITDPGNVFWSGDWVSDASFQPTAARSFTFNGSSGSIRLASSTCLPVLTVASGATLTVLSDLCVTTDVIVQGTLINAFRVEAQRDCLNSSGTIDLLNVGTLAVGRNLTNNGGTFVRNGTLVMTGTGTVQNAGANSFLHLEVDAPGGTATVAGMVPLAGNFTLRDGTLRTLDAAAVLQVAGTADLLGGALGGSGGDAGTLDFNGDVNIANLATASAPPRIQCAGNWTADLSFDPQSNVVELDGSGVRLLASTDPGRQLLFHELMMAAGEWRPAMDLIVMAREPLNGLRIASGATLELDGRNLSVPCTRTYASGVLSCSGGSRLSLDAASWLIVEPGGTLRLVGTRAQPLVIDVYQTPGYRLHINGMVEASNFVCEGMNAEGIKILAGATLGPAPNDFRAGTFRNGASGPGTVFLDVARTTPTDLRYLVFDNTGGSTEFNVRSLTTAPIRMVNAGGNWAGPAHEDDPNDVIDWVSESTNLNGPFRARGLLGRIRLSFATTREVDVGMLHVTRATSPSGPFGALVSLTPQGAPFRYTFDDVQVVANTRYFYRLDEELTHGPRSQLGEDSAQTLPMLLNNAAFVGPGGFADIDAAIAAVPSGGCVVVAEGTYPTFTVTKSLHVMPEGSGPVRIDVTTGPLRIADLPASTGPVALYDLVVTPDPTTFGLEVVNCGNEIILDGLVVTAMTGVDAVLVDSSPKVVLQDCALRGPSSLRTRNAAKVYLSLGEVESLIVEAGGGTLTYADVTPGTIQGTATPLTGSMPSITFDPQLFAIGKTDPVILRGDPGWLWFALLGAQKTYFETPFLGIDMVLLVDPFSALVGQGVIPAAGESMLPLAVPPAINLAGFGLGLQAVMTGPGLPTAARWSTVRDLLFVP